MTIALIAFLLILGIALLLAEFLLIPGITIAGVGGFLAIAAGIILTYTSYGTTTGTLVLGLTLLVSFISIYYSLRSKSWNKLSLHQTISSKAQLDWEGIISPGDRGISVTRLAPGGEVKIGVHTLEALSQSGFVDVNKPVEVVKTDRFRVIVKPL